MNRDELAAVLELHGKWIRGESGGRKAHLYGANLSRANLYGANLYGANLYGANLWEAYLTEVVPALLTAGGKPLAEVANETTWACHTWSRPDGIACPIGTAYDCNNLRNVPPLYRQQAERFVSFFDRGLIPLEAVLAKPSPEEVLG